jgi:hypothetical protein
MNYSTPSTLKFALPLQQKDRRILKNESFFLSSLLESRHCRASTLHFAIQYDRFTHRLNMELDLQSSNVYLGSMCTAVLIGWDPATALLPRHLGSYTSALLVYAKRDDISLWPPGFTELKLCSWYFKKVIILFTWGGTWLLSGHTISWTEIYCNIIFHRIFISGKSSNFLSITKRNRWPIDPESPVN